MSPTPDSQSLTRFLIWAGAFLLVAAFVVPAFVLRDTDVLTISKEDLNGFTPVAKEEIERRQAVARDVGDVAPEVGVAFFIAGTVLLVLGIPRLRQQEQGDEERRKMEREKLDAELRPQSKEERTNQLKEDVADDEKEPPSPAPTVESPPSEEEVRRRRRDRIREAAKAQDAVLARIAKIAAPLYNLEPQVAFNARGATRFLDGLLISEIDQLPDIVIEIKFISARTVEVARRIREGRHQLLGHLARYNRPSRGWLIVVIDSRAELEAVKDKVSGKDDAIHLSVVALDDLDQLQLPV